MSETRILIIDDEPLIRLAMADYLTEYGYQTVTAGDGVEGLTQARSGRFHAILVDLRMPRVDGLEVIATLKAEQPKLPTVVVSGTGVLSDAIEAMRLGAWDYITKPIQDMDEITVVIEQVLDKARLMAERERAEEALQIAHDELEQRVEERTAELTTANAALQAEIIERKRMAKALRESEKRFRALVQHSSDIIVLLDADGTVRYVSPAVERILGYPPDSFVGQNPLEHVHLGDVEATQQVLDAVMQQPGTPILHEFRLRHVDGSWVHIETVINNLLHDPSVQSLVVNARDVTERERLIAQFLQAQKMEAVGRLAGGVAHDFNNLLTVIQISAQLVMRQLRPEDPLWEHVQQIKKAGERASRLTRQLLSFSRKEVVEPRVVQINRVVKDLSRMLHRIIGEDIELTITLADTLWPVKIDPSQIEQVIVNLAVNARDAMPKGGRLSLKTANIVLDEADTVHRPEVQSGEYVMLSISDTGVGIDDKIKAHLFEPFFTTKDSGQGTGLGLSTVYGIVKQNRGDIQFASQVGQGTTFTIYLPRATKKETPSQVHLQNAPGSTLRGSETILVVEDEASVRELAVHILKTHGYQVLAAQNGPEALQISSEYDNPIHLLLTDVVMPEMNGKELVERLQRQQPQLQVLYMSGYSDDVIAHHDVFEKGVVFLSKPFTLEALTQKVRDVLER